ncbi:hypothetical protein AMS68_005330 [Peltaster fructicola]|uniref:RNA helicase n=1 Tax=Peltaster fructicola TaxID=286661 RepID=A0A6H0XYH9_9PEZI|nr:hypothetical protein AMS68_005330 [Peltaster fructicola]
MSKRVRDEEAAASNGVVDRKSKKQKSITDDADNAAQTTSSRPAVPAWKQELRDKRKVKKELKRRSKAARKLAKREAAAALEAKQQVKAVKAESGIAADEEIKDNAITKDEEKALKKAKKAARKAAKAAEGAELPVPAALEPHSELASDNEEKEAAAAKAARKAAKQAAKQQSKLVNTVDNTASIDGSIYIEHAGLATLPASDISSFLTTKQITVTNSGAERRPIISFDYLPITEEQRTPFKGFSTPTPIQAAAWPYLLDGRDVVGVAETGSGKTLAFGVPCIRRLSALDKKARSQIKACIVSPTRELALQIQEQLAKFTAPFGLKVTCVYGGVSKDDQRAELRGTQIVVATPGRLNDFIQEGSIDLSHVDYMVLDEADRMLDKGFEEEVRKIVSSTASTGRQTLMFTATWPPSVRDLAGTFMNNPVRINIGENTSGELRANTRIVQEVEVLEQHNKQDRLIQLLKQYQSGKNRNDKILVFCLYKKEATRIEEFIQRRGFNVAGIHGDLSQQKRTESLEAFKQGKVLILVATDVAARGLDIPAVKLVINVTFPLTAEDYVHRIGRTGRAGQDGKAITFFTDQEKGLAGALINVLKGANQPVPEELLKYGTTVKKKAHDAYGAFYKDTTDMKAATKITFD